MQYLHERQYYDDLYDKITVDHCRRAEAAHQKIYKKYINDNNHKEEDVKRAFGISYHIDMLFTTGERQVNKEQKIREWMERDRTKQQKYEEAEAPEGVRCKSCKSVMHPTFRSLCDWGEEPERVLFMYDCPNKCLPRRSFYDDGTEYVSQPRLCKQCKAEVTVTDSAEGGVIKVVEHCPECHHEEIDTYESPKEVVDPDFEADKQRFCNLNDKQIEEYLKTKQWFVDVKAFMEDMEERDKHKEEYDAIKQLDKLTVPVMQKRLQEVLLEHGYEEVSFEKPDMGKSVQVAFTCLDGKGREQYSSRQELKKTILSCLEPTNWRLMSDGVDYRLGVLTGRVRCYESEEEMMQLVTKKKT